MTGDKTDMEISQGVHLIKGVRGSNCYLVTHPELTLIDTGMPGQHRKILSYITSLGYENGKLRRIILTHHDLDHMGSAADLQRVTGAAVCIHRADADCVLGRSPRRPFWKAWLSSLATLWPEFRPPEITRLLEDGQNMDLLQVIHTPGHSAGSITVKYGPVLFVGDLLRWGRVFKQTPRCFNEDSSAIRDSIKKIASLDFDLLCPGHGKPVFGASHKLRELGSRWSWGRQ